MNKYVGFNQINWGIYEFIKPYPHWVMGNILKKELDDSQSVVILPFYRNNNPLIIVRDRLHVERLSYYEYPHSEMESRWSTKPQI